jgi:hypothetical protein
LTQLARAGSVGLFAIKAGSLQTNLLDRLNVETMVGNVLVVAALYPPGYGAPNTN